MNSKKCRGLEKSGIQPSPFSEPNPTWDRFKKRKQRRGCIFTRDWCRGSIKSVGMLDGRTSPNKDNYSGNRERNR